MAYDYGNIFEAEFLLTLKMITLSFWVLEVTSELLPVTFEIKTIWGNWFNQEIALKIMHTGF